MRKKLHRMATPLCLCLLIFAPFARAMQSTSPQSQEDIDQTNGAIENLCAPAVNTESSKELMNFALDYEQLERVRIELLERGFNPGFHPERGRASDTQLTEAVTQFQSEYHLPVTGQIDAPTLVGLNIPIEKSRATNSEEPKRSKPSK